MNKLIINILRIVIPIIIIVVMIPVLLNSSSNLIQYNRELDSEKKTLIPAFEQDLANCANSTGQYQINCKQLINNDEKLVCGTSGNPDICNDPRINEILSANTPNPIFIQPTSFTTYTNNKWRFSIEYPNTWVIDENLPDGNIGIKDKMNAPNVLFEIKHLENNGNSFDYVVNKYVSQVGMINNNDYPITLQSQENITIGDKNAYRLQYTITIGSTTCRDDDFIINEEVVPVISYNSCDADLFSQFQPTFEKIAYTFR